MFHQDQEPLITQLEAINRETVIEKRAMKMRAERVMDDMRHAAALDAIGRLDEALKRAN